MAGYWLKRGPNAPAEGPFTATQLKQMGAAGQIATDALVSGDNAQWTRADKVKGLFAATPSAPMPTPQAPAPAPIAPSPAPMPPPPALPASAQPPQSRAPDPYSIEEPPQP